jgi:acyl-[acyl-carrier-protein]-phospholipid O-acyltransferase/long-chain-fatty-acid--[acyl-carrier-protein] ligase
MNNTDWHRTPSWIDRGIERIVRAVVLGVGRLFYRVEIRGSVPREGGAVFVCNHVSYADTIPLSLACARRFRFTSFDGLFRLPLLGRCLRAFGSIPVNRSQAREAIRRMADCAGAGEAVLVFPEGQLTLDGRVQEIKGGYEVVARHAKCPVVMVHLDGLWGSIFSFEGGRWFFKWPRPWRRSVTVTFSRPQSADDATPERLRNFWERCAQGTACPGSKAVAGRPLCR